MHTPVPLWHAESSFPTIDRLPAPLQELAHEEVVRQLQLEQAKQVTKLRQEVEQGARDLASKADRRMKVGCCGSRSFLHGPLPGGGAFLLPSGSSTPGAATPGGAHSG